jgi:hypothetical protein
LVFVAPLVACVPLVAVPLSAAVFPAAGLVPVPMAPVEAVLLAPGLIPVEAAEAFPPTCPVTWISSPMCVLSWSRLPVSEYVVPDWLVSVKTPEAAEPLRHPVMLFGFELLPAAAPVEF